MPPFHLLMIKSLQCPEPWTCRHTSNFTHMSNPTKLPGSTHV